MRLSLVTDAWAPQVNGVVRTLSTVCAELEKKGDEISVIHPGLFRTLPCPTYPDIRLSFPKFGEVARLLDASRPEAIHIATEGPLGLIARRYCRKRGLAFTTAFHTRFPEYVEARTRLPVSVSYAWLRRFHGEARAVMAPTPTVVKDLEAHGFRNVVEWGRGVDVDAFHPDIVTDVVAHVRGPRPWLLYVGRVAVEKNIEAFLSLDTPGTKIVVGDGPQRAALQARHPEVHFAGARHGAELSAFYAASDVFVFPSRTDTFGLVLLEALACGTPVAAYPVMGPIDVITDPKTGALDDDLGRAVETALRLDRADCRAFAQTKSWAECAESFRSHLHPIRSEFIPCASPSPSL